MYWAIPNWRQKARNLGLTVFCSYLLHLTLPKQQHFDRYIEERKKYEPEFAMRMEHPKCEIQYNDMFLFAKVVVDSCAFKTQNESPFGANLGKSRWVYYGVLNNFWYERRTL